MSRSKGAPAPTTKFAYPFAISQADDATVPESESAETYFRALARAEDGFFPIGANGQWHGGLHFGRETGATLDQDAGVRCIADGEVLAYRIDDEYPVVEYSSRAPARYSTGFVLVRHRLQLPAIPRIDRDHKATAGADAASQALAEPSLVFYSLYMHLQNWKAYSTDIGYKRPAFWDGAEEYVVGEKARDNEERLAPGVTGLRVRDASHRPIALLPRGTRLTLGASVGSHAGFHAISGIIRGNTVPAGRHVGRVYLPELDRLTTPSAMGTVVVLKEPAAIMAGELVGHPGEYQRHGDMDPFAASRANRPLVQVDVFTGDDLEAFIGESRARDAQLDAKQKTFLHIRCGARLVQPTAPDIELAVGEAAVCVGSNAGERWAKGTRGTIHTVERSMLTGFTPATRAYADGRLFISAVRPDDGSEITLEQYNALSAANKAGYSYRKVLEPAGEDVWVDGQATNASNPIYGPAFVWSDFPLKLANASDPVVSHSRVLRARSVEATALEADGTRWFRATAGGGSAGTMEGWVREKDHPNVALCSPWAWPGFVLMDAGTLQPKDLYARAIIRDPQATASEQKQLESLTQSAEQSPLFDSLCAAIDADGKDGITPLELRRALGKPWLAQALSHLVIKHHSEWAGPMDRWDAIDELIPSSRREDWEQEKGRIKTLQFWGDIKSKSGFPTQGRVQHLHPIGLIANFACSCRFLNVNTFMDIYRTRHGEFGNSSGKQLDAASEQHLRVLIEGIVNYYASTGQEYFIPHVAYMLATARHETLWRETYFEPRTEGGPHSYFNKYDPVLAGTRAHKDRAVRMGNTKEGDGYKYRGRGYVQLTWKVKYQLCGDHLGIDLAQRPDLALEPEHAAGCMIHGMFSGVFTGRRITRYINEAATDYFNARRVINGTDKAAVIQAYAELFEDILEASRC
ncbi:calcium-binding protein [Lysobacter sp. GX 14042]|uniref:calcium-binding protein n=1 Tax=Lysobacter sp. GX 14042 TaxID=2907155 RepID=UPI001F41F7B7|nr:calcium-binding protein [Lysobacter sp. GX 14042]MCE7031996.1 calcium-binding protein [Lysobacter sp. GX 14042]